MGLIPKDTIYCSSLQLQEFKTSLDFEDTLSKVFQNLENDKDEIWFDIYRSITNS